MDLDAFIDGACVQQDGKLIISQPESMNEFVLPHSPMQTSGSTLQSLLTHGYMPLLQNRLQNGPPIKIEAPSSSTSYCGEIITTSTSPPGSVVSTTDNLMLNGRYLHSHQSQSHHYQLSLSGNNNNSLKGDGLCSPELMGNYPHTTTTTPSSGPKQKRQRQPKNSSKSQNQINLNAMVHSGNSQVSNPNNSSSQISGGGCSNASQSALSYQSSNDLSGLLGKEKPVHRCNICNRGFLNKSNIKVHLRTHTGEKPFRCEVCSKAFRQKAHLIKHQQMHRGIGRD
jgi:hypothetical protein